MNLWLFLFLVALDAALILAYALQIHKDIIANLTAQNDLLRKSRIKAAGARDEAWALVATKDKQIAGHLRESVIAQFEIERLKRGVVGELDADDVVAQAEKWLETT